MDEVGPLVAIAAAAGWYASGVVRAWDRAGRGRIIRTGEVAAFAAGCAVLVVSLAGPLDAGADRALWDHMIQHVALISVAAPLLALGAPLKAGWWALPDDLRPRRHPLRARLRGIRWFAAVAGTLALHTVAVLAWHLPAAYDAAVRDPAVHALQHASFLFTAVALWWAVLEAGGRSHRGAGVVTIFLACLPTSGLGVLMTLAGTPWYRVYLRADPAAALEDQQVAGVIMWAFAGLLALVAAAVLFITWMDGLERADPGRGVTTSTVQGAIPRRSGPVADRS